MMKVSELEGGQLDYWVSRALLGERDPEDLPPQGRYSLLWSLGGPLIEREGISVSFLGGRWAADHRGSRAYGATPLVAAMRCIVASRFGEDVPATDREPQSVAMNAAPEPRRAPASRAEALRWLEAELAVSRRIVAVKDAELMLAKALLQSAQALAAVEELPQENWDTFRQHIGRFLG